MSSLRLLLPACSKLRAHDMQADKDRRNHSSYDSENETERGSEGQMTPIRQEESACFSFFSSAALYRCFLPSSLPRPPPRAKSIRCYCEMNSPEGQTRARSPTDRPVSHFDGGASASSVQCASAFGLVILTWHLNCKLGERGALTGGRTDEGQSAMKEGMK